MNEAAVTFGPYMIVDSNGGRLIVQRRGDRITLTGAGLDLTRDQARKLAAALTRAVNTVQREAT